MYLCYSVEILLLKDNIYMITKHIKYFKTNIQKMGKLLVENIRQYY